MRIRTAAFLVVGLVLFSCLAEADAPSRIPVQGVLTDAAGQRVDGIVSITFAIYDSHSGGIQFWSETQEVSVENGLFSVYLGDTQEINLALFKGRDDLWLSMQIVGESEFARIYLGATPFAAYAQHGSYTGGEGITITDTNVVSSTLGDFVESQEIADATIQFADLAQNGCSTDQIIRWNGSAWICSDPPTASGVPSGAVMTFNLPNCPEGWSELTGAQGRFIMGLPAGGTLAATQGSALPDQGTRTISQVPEHTHPVDPPAANSDNVGAHAHGLNDPGHSHTFWTTGPAGGTRAHFAGSAYVPDDTSSDTTGITIQQGGAHEHSLDIDSFASGPAGQAAVDVTPPYIQLLVCQKN